MDDALKRLILELLGENRIMTIATNRPDGWPHATVVGYVNTTATTFYPLYALSVGISRAASLRYFS